MHLTGIPYREFSHNALDKKYKYSDNSENIHIHQRSKPSVQV